MDENTWARAAYEVKQEVERKMWSSKGHLELMIWQQLYRKICKLSEGFKEMDI